MNVLTHTATVNGSPGMEHKLLVETAHGLLREDGKRLIGSFHHRCGELMREGWQPKVVQPRCVTFSREPVAFREA